MIHINHMPRRPSLTRARFGDSQEVFFLSFFLLLWSEQRQAGRQAVRRTAKCFLGYPVARKHPSGSLRGEFRQRWFTTYASVAVLSVACVVFIHPTAFSFFMSDASVTGFASTQANFIGRKLNSNTLFFGGA